MRLCLPTSCTLALCLLASAAARAQDYPIPPPPPPPPLPADAAPAPGYLPPPPPEARLPVVPIAPTAQVTVRFVPKSDGDEYFVATVEGAEPLKAPCDLRLSPGKLKLQVTGDASFSQRLVVPDAAPSKATIEHRNKGLMVMGIVGVALTAIGVVMLETPVEALVSGFLQAEWNNTSFDANTVTRSDVVTGISFQNWMIASGVAVGVGVVCAAVGFAKMGHARVVLVPDDRVTESTDAPKLELVGLGLAPTASGAVAGATFAF